MRAQIISEPSMQILTVHQEMMIDYSISASFCIFVVSVLVARDEFIKYSNAFITLQ